MGCPETSIQNYQSMLCKISEERRSHLLRGGSLRSSNVMIDCCFTNTKAKLFFLCVYLEPDNIANCKLPKFHILQRVLCTATAISFNRPARGRIFFSSPLCPGALWDPPRLPSPGYFFFFNPRVIQLTREITISLLVLRVRIRGPLLPIPH
jgi:hypothetical protein